MPTTSPVAGDALLLVTVIVSVNGVPTVCAPTVEMLTPTSTTPKFGAPSVVAAANTSEAKFASRLSRLSASLVKRTVEPSALMTGWKLWPFAEKPPLLTREMILVLFVAKSRRKMSVRLFVSAAPRLEASLKNAT